MTPTNIYETDNDILTIIIKSVNFISVCSVFVLLAISIFSMIFIRSIYTNAHAESNSRLQCM